MKKLFIGLQVGVYCLLLVLILTFGLVFKFNRLSFMLSLYLAMGFGFLGIVVVLISALQGNVIKRLTCAIHVSISAIAVLMYYLTSYLIDYDNHSLLLWLLFILVSIVTGVVLLIVNLKLSDRKLVMKK